MSRENVERVPDDDLHVMRLWFDRWNRAEYDAFFDLYDANAEVITDPSWVEAGPFKGRPAIRAWLEGLRQSWGEQDAIVLRELFEAGDKVVARLDWRVRGRSSGIETHLDATSVNTIERGKIVHQRYYFDHEEAPSKPWGCGSSRSGQDHARNKSPSRGVPPAQEERKACGDGPRRSPQGSGKAPSGERGLHSV